MLQRDFNLHEKMNYYVGSVLCKRDFLIWDLFKLTSRKDNFYLNLNVIIYTEKYETCGIVGAGK